MQIAMEVCLTALPLPGTALPLPATCHFHCLAVHSDCLPLHCTATALPGTALQGPSLPKMKVLDTHPMEMTVAAAAAAAAVAASQVGWESKVRNLREAGKKKTEEVLGVA